ncbi:MAG TPA: ATP-binding protein [Thermoanaerobaculia bacterium]|nr:ATP-binding protein [Thermoanaerobaculia bacterium]
MSYHDEAERAQALASLARGCQERDARLAFLSSQAVCEATRQAVCRIDAALLPLLSFRPVDFPVINPKSDQAWASTIEVIRAALLETSAVGSPVVAWIESPLPLKGVAKAKVPRAYDEMLTALARGGAVASVISAFRLAGVSARALLSILDSSSAVISAKMTLPHCPPWLISQTESEHPSGSGISTAHHTDPIFTPMFQAERLVALGQLGAGFAHELGNPLSIISSSLQYLHKRLAETNDPASDFTMTALHNVERMRGLLGSMLDFAGVKKPRYEHVDLKEAISEVLRFTSPECAQRGISVEVSFDPFLPPALVDPGGVKQIVLNLVKNALDAITQGEENAGESTLRLRTRMGSQGTAVIEVENSGVAIPADVLPYLFRPFFTTKDGGTGLGLYLSRQIAEDHGGQLEVENVPNAVRFTLTLPLEQREE